MQIKFMYRNHRGNISERTVRDARIIYDYSVHPEFGYVQPGWYIHGIDEEKNAGRSFALHNIVIPPDSQGAHVYQLLMVADGMTFGIPIS